MEHSYIKANKQKTIILIVFFLAILGALGYLAGLYAGNWSITAGALIGSLAYAAFSYFGSARAALSMTNAQEIQQRDNPRLWRVVENLAITSGMPMPKVYIIPDRGLNAFATGRDPQNAHVAITSGLLETLDKSELEGVMAHELGHIKNYDIRVSMVVFGLVMAISIFSDIFMRMTFFGGRDRDEDSNSGLFALLGIAAAIIAPLVAGMVQAAVSRQREYLADATGAMTTRYPEGLARALKKLEAGNTKLRQQSSATAHLFIANPLKSGGLARLMDTHPPLQNRIERLMEMDTTV